MKTSLCPSDWGMTKYFGYRFWVVTSRLKSETVPSHVHRRQCEFIAPIDFVCVCVCIIYLGSKSKTAGNEAVCQNLLIGIWGRNYKRWETYIHIEGRRKNVERKSPFTNSRHVLLLPLLSFCSPVPLQFRLTVPCVQTFLALVALLGLQHQPPYFTATTLEKAVPCSASRAMRDHTFLSSSLVLLCSRSCKWLEYSPAFRDSCLSCTTCWCIWTVHTVEVCSLLLILKVESSLPYTDR